MNAIFITQDAHAGSLITRWAHQHYIRDVDRGFKLDNTRSHASALSLILTLMFLADIDTLNGNASLSGIYLNHLAAFALIFGAATDDFNSIAFFYFFFHVYRSYCSLQR